MKGAILTVLLVLGTYLVIPASSATNNLKENSGQEPIWGKTYVSTYTNGGPPEIYFYYSIYTHPNDNITINVTVTNSYSQIWFGGYKSELLGGAMPQYFGSLPPIVFNSSSNDGIASAGYIDTTMNFWLVSATYQVLVIIVRQYSPSTIQYTINKINAMDQTKELQNQLDNLTMNITNLAINLNELQNYTQWVNQSVQQNLSTIQSDLSYMQDWRSWIMSLEDQLNYLNASYQENLSPIQTYLESTNASIKLLQEAWLSTTKRELDDINSIIANLTAMGDAINRIKQPINNTTMVNQTFVNQTLVNKTEVQPVTYINKTIERKSTPEYLMSSIAGALGGVIGGFIIASVMMRRKKEPEIVYMKNVEPPEALREQMMSVRKLQSEGSEAEVPAEESERRK